MHEAELRRWMRRRMANDVDAEATLQDLVLRALRQRERYYSILSARARLFTVAWNAIADPPFDSLAGSVWPPAC